MRTPKSKVDKPIGEIKLETPSGKSEASENFPVGSWLLPKVLRPHIAKFYRFARTIDDIADHPDTPADQKISNLEAFEDALNGRVREQASLETAHQMRESLLDTGIPIEHCTDLIKAFKQDSRQDSYQNWDALMAYCRLSAAPVGRYLIDLHGGSTNGYGPSDALCKALQVINHLQDCQDDYQELGRVYLPTDWMAEEGVNAEELDHSQASPGMRRVLDRMLAQTATLMELAALLPRGVVSWRLAMEAAVIIEIANRLIIELKKRDPLSEHIKLSKGAVLLCGSKGIIRGILTGMLRVFSGGNKSNI